MCCLERPSLRQVCPQRGKLNVGFTGVLDFGLAKAVEGAEEFYLRAMRVVCGSQKVEDTREVNMAFRLQRNMGMLVLSVWLILYGLSGLVALGLPAPLLGILALIAGVLILAGR